jgi:glycosyltransferase involved in cell wall biosynthesis
VDLRAGRAAKAFENTPFDVVHIFRLAALPYAESYLDPKARRPPQRHLDLDEIESVTHSRIAALCRATGHNEAARREEEAAQRCAALEQRVLKQLDRIYVSSKIERSRLVDLGLSDLRLLPNTVRVPEPPPPYDGPPSFLFVGTLGYFPNEDAVRWLAQEVFPRMQEWSLSVRIAGSGATDALGHLAGDAGMAMLGKVEDLAPLYRSTTGVLVPLRAGGGTRIKVLEAMAYRRPVVSTTFGVEGLEVTAGEHVLLGDSAD